MGNTFGLLLVAIVLAACSPSPEVRESVPDRTTLSKPTGCSQGAFQLAFVSTHTGRHQIHLLEPKASGGIAALTEGKDFVGDPTWSPDGKRIAFRSLRLESESPGVYVAKADGSRRTLLVRRAAMPAWSPNGRFIAFANLRPHSRGISIVKVSQALGGTPRIYVVTRTHEATPEEQPEWSPDGRRIAFTSHRGGSSDIWVVDARGGQPQRLTSEPSLDNSPAWSPDGSLIAFGSNRDSPSIEGGDIYVKPDGTGVVRLTDDHAAYTPAWSPDGCLLAYNSLPSAIWTMQSNGSNGRRVTPALKQPNGEPASVCCAAWRPEAE
jgi:TolB protein